MTAHGLRAELNLANRVDPRRDAIQRLTPSTRLFTCRRVAGDSRTLSARPNPEKSRMALKNGSKGPEIEQLQKDLNTLGFTIGVDGIFAEDTLSAVEQLQWMFGYTVDGVVGEGTQKLIGAQKANGWNGGTREGLVAALRAQGKSEGNKVVGVALESNLKSGAKGADVAYLQRRLRALGFDAPLNASFDEQTLAAVKELQAAWGYDVDGIVGPGTHGLINAQLGYGWSKGQPTR
jgi:peptidoglycan hydrolase-like protein with peptidoglycan-binding domain